MRRDDIKVNKLTENFWLIEAKDNPIRPDLTEQYQLVKHGCHDIFTLSIINVPVATISIDEGLMTAKLCANNEVVYTAKVGNTTHFKNDAEAEKLLKSAAKKVMESKWWTK